MSDPAEIVVPIMTIPAKEAVIYGIIGGLIGEVTRWFAIRDELYKGIPVWAKSKAYWIITILMILSGGGLVYFYADNGTNFTSWLAFNVGLTAPLLLAKAKDAAPPIEPGSYD